MGMSEKGVEIQLHWIFVMIAGALILAFFITIATKQRALSQEKLQWTLATSVESVLTSALLSKGAAQPIPIPSQGLDFSCSKTCDCAMNIGGARRPFGLMQIFGPSRLNKGSALVWSIPWNIPYRVSNFLILVSPETKYFFVYNPSDSQSKALLSQIERSLPPPLIRNGITVAKIDYKAVESKDVNQLVAEDYSHYRFVFLNTPPSPLDRSFRKESADAIVITKDSIEFYSKSKSSFIQEGLATYAGLPSILAAIFSDSQNRYSCGIRSALNRLSYISSLYVDRSRSLFSDRCDYTTINRLLSEQSSLAGQLSRDLELSRVNRLVGLQQALERENRRLVEQSCPEMF
ncbi:hypothetical protein D6825_01225 [Candidatus Woesearchaeota archaeon]|nr:MAG: hypothetical protein D6825_01225 [Candidatus Woesearchaeota archaeon]